MKIKLQTAVVGCSFVFLALTSCIKENWGGVSIVTGTPSNITNTTATFNCSIDNDGGSTITQRGVCISQSLNPTVADSTIVVGEGLGSYTITATGLLPNTEYHVRAYAINSEGTYYGPDKTFKTLDPAWILPPCTISPNTMDNGSYPIYFNSVFIEAGINLYQGNFALTGNGSVGDMSFYFFEEPITGKYITASSLDENSNMNCCVSGVFGGTSSFFYTAAANDTVYVENLGNGKYKMSFCNLNFFSTENSFFGKGNLKN